MKEIQVEPDVLTALQARAVAGETPSDVLRREVAGVTIEIDDDTFAALMARSQEFGESASQIIRRTILDSPEPVHPGPRTVTFTIAAGTGAGPWNAVATAVAAHVGDTLHLVNDDTIPHEVHTGGSPFAHPSQAIAPGASADYPLTAEFSGQLYDHTVGPAAAFWINVGPAN